MKSTLIFLPLIFCAFLAAAQDKAAVNNKSPKTSAKKVAVSGTITQTSAYCGGARPPDEVFEQLATPRPFPGKKLYVIKGEKNSAARKIVLSFIADSSGNFSFHLPPGKYSILMEEQTKPFNPKDYITEFITVDETCLKGWWEKPYYLLEVKKSPVKELKINFYHRCFVDHDILCLQYTGPTPP